jgi:hypothetical protein
MRVVDDSNLDDRHWSAEVREVELWENERWSVDGGWGKTHLKSGERSAWTRGRDGWSGVKEDGSGDVRSVFPSYLSLIIHVRNGTDEATAATLHSLFPQAGHSSKQKTGELISR